MGLDFGVYYRKKNAYTEDDFDANQLCYGRKCWELVHIMEYDTEGSCNYEITEDMWNKVIKAIEPIGDKLPAIREAFDKARYEPEDFGELILTRDDKKLIAEYEYWYNRTFEESPCLGYDFSVWYMLDFWEARDKVKQYFDDPDYEVWCYASY